ncbi:glutamate synthase-related protein [Acidaminobacter sp.]|uniref:glutamate synthase-related protein n=1 Tax=Acidaminobacter sp. TaxID=1872102 RepID=UPI001384C7A1|nr:glutamate synthase-related protein [Acidaminobacter sp.]MDK9711537.1 glutamate synthase-related protein [Acidaminobacter sp.]MZQ96350.1 FMN-binding glutamate synthase family protein [Acidaminobacter sp.]
MSFSPSLGTTVTNTRMRTEAHTSPFSGMCAVCTMDCPGSCEIGLSALRGPEAIYPFAADSSQFASEKNYPLDFSHLNINGRVFGARGTTEDSDAATYAKVKVETSIGKKHPLKLRLPIVLPAMAKLNWQDYFAGAAMAGVLVVIGEDVVAKDKGLVLENGRVKAAPLIADMVGAFRKFERGYGDIVLQANEDDERLGVLDYALQHLGVKSVELKFGQAAKGIQGLGLQRTLEDALRLKNMGYLVFPDPTDPEVAARFNEGKGPVFEKVGRLPMWDEVSLKKRIAELRALGAERICFKTGPFDPEDLARILRIASEEGVDLVTLDGAGGGTGNSPVKMMNEWGIPTVVLESLVYEILKTMEEKGYDLPQVAITGGFSMEDHVFKGLALGAPYVSLVGIGRAAMAAAMTGKRLGELLKEDKLPQDLSRFGGTVETLFSEVKPLRAIYGDEADAMSTGAIGLYSYLERISAGLRQLMALNRKFDLSHVDRRDLVPLTPLAKEVTGLEDYSDLMRGALGKL